MSQGGWTRHAGLVAALPLALCLSLPLVAQTPNIPHDSQLLEKLYKGDFMHISDDNEGRMDLEATLMAFAHSKCQIWGQPSSSSILSMAKYIKYLDSDSVTGNYPSEAFKAIGYLGLLSKNPEAVWLLDPNAMAIVSEATAHGCDSDRLKRIGKNILQALDHHIAWHEQKLGRRAPLMNQAVTAISRDEWQGAVAKDVSLPAQDQTLRQIAELQAQGAQYLLCVYGPTNPDSTGSDKLSFWYKNVPIPGAELMKVSRRHPLAEFGDVAITACPANVADARHKLGESQHLAQSRADPSTLPTPGLPLELAMGKSYLGYMNVKKSWIAYQSTHDSRDQQQAINAKAGLLGVYRESCQRTIAATGGEKSLACQIERQLLDEFRDIPGSPSAANQAAAPMRLFHPAADAPPPLRTAPNGGSRAPQAAISRGGPANAPSSTEAFSLPAGTQLLVRTSEAIDLTSDDRSRRYRAQLARPVQNRTGVVLVPQGSDVVLKMSHQDQSNYGIVYAVLTVESVAVEGKLVPVATRPVLRPAARPGMQRRAPLELRPQTTVLFVVESSGN